MKRHISITPAIFGLCAGALAGALRNNPSANYKEQMIYTLIGIMLLALLEIAVNFIAALYLEKQ